jgi:hypothetical protein
VRDPRTRKRLSAGVAASVFALVALFPLAMAGAADAGTLLTWSKLTPNVAPLARFHAALALDAATGTTVLFGGRSGNQMLADTWTWDGSTWTVQSPAASPPPLESASMAYDNIGRRIILFGGLGSDGKASSATWAWDGTTWSALTTTTVPPARYAASIAADSASNSDVLFGGLAAPGTPLSDTWSWDGTNWTLDTAAVSPSARAGAAMTFDATRGVVVLFGGTTGTDYRADTWTWDGQNWTQQAPGSSPPARSDAALGFDTATQNAVLFGGSGGGSAAGGALGDTWLWNGSNWSPQLPALSLLNPPSRIGASLADGPADHRLVLFGGQLTGSNAGAVNDTWTVTTVVPSPAAPPTTAPGSAAGGPTTTVAGATPSTTPATKAPTTTTVHPSPTTGVAPGSSPLTLTSRSVQRGGQVTVSGSGFVPGAQITITFHSARVVVGTTVADAQGHFSTTVVVPSDVATGTHDIEAAGAARSGGRAVLVAQVRIMAPGNHSWLLPALMVALTVLLAAGAGVVLTASTGRYSNLRWLPHWGNRD